MLVNYDGEYWPEDLWDDDEDDDTCPECHGEGWTEGLADDIMRTERICGLCQGLGFWSPSREHGEPSE